MNFSDGGPAFPVIGADGLPSDYTGMTKREAFAMAAMQGILANRAYDPPRRNKLAGMAEDAVSAADALLAELAKERA